MLVLLDRLAPQSCVDGQLYGDSCDVHKYYQCASGVAHQFQCATGTVWDERIKNCNWDYLVLTSPTPCGCGRESVKVLNGAYSMGHCTIIGMIYMYNLRCSLDFGI